MPTLALPQKCPVVSRRLARPVGQDYQGSQYPRRRLETGPYREIRCPGITGKRVRITLQDANGYLNEVTS